MVSMFNFQKTHSEVKQFVFFHLHLHNIHTNQIYLTVQVFKFCHFLFDVCNIEPDLSHILLLHRVFIISP
jgi:hypothetical protein